MIGDLHSNETWFTKQWEVIYKAMKSDLQSKETWFTKQCDVIYMWEQHNVPFIIHLLEEK